MSLPYRRILLPLDGTHASEAALAHALVVAEGTAATVTLLRVVSVKEVLESDGHPLHAQAQYEIERARAFRYLDQLRHRFGGRPVTIDVAVELGVDAQAIVDFARARSIDLIVMATKSRTGLMRWVLGSVADKVLRAAPCPVLAVRSADDGT